MNFYMKKTNEQHGVTMIEVLVALAILATALVMGIYPVWFYAGRQAVLSSQESIARNLLEEQIQMYQFYDWTRLTTGDLVARGGPPNLTTCASPGFPDAIDPANLLLQVITVNGMKFNRVWKVTWPDPTAGGTETAHIETWVYWNSAFGCRAIRSETVFNCNRGDIKFEFGNNCP